MKHKSGLTILCMMLFMQAFSQLQNLDSLLGEYRQKATQEKIHIHFDNSRYLPGQTIWYKAYLLKGDMPSDLSKNLYLDWFDGNGKLLSQTIAPVANAVSFGNYTVPETFKGSHLQVLAYTRWMLNFDSVFLFRHTIPVTSSQLSASAAAAIIPETTLQFFPEGGDLVEDIPSILAFKAINSEGMPVSVTGTIFTKNKQPVSQFATTHNGMGKISFTALPGESYTAEWADPQGNTRTTVLPTPRNTGLVITLSEAADNRFFSIQRKADSEERFKKVSVVATLNEQLLFRANANLMDKTKITASMPVADFPSGVVRLTVFDVNRQPVAERIFFVNNEEYRLIPELITDTLNLEKRGKNVYQLSLSDTVPATLSVSVTDGQDLHDTSRNIFSQFLLSSEIKGHVHQPAYYFSSNTGTVLQDLDLVMLTNGWRRFSWEHVLTGTAPLFRYSRDTGYLSIAGKIDNLSDARIKRAETLNLVLMAKDSTKQFIFTPLQPDGSFREDDLVLFDTTKVFYQLNKTFIPARSRVNIRNTFLPFDSLRTIRSLQKYLPDTTGMARIKAILAEQKRVEELMKQASLKEVIVRTKVKTRLQEMDEKYTRSGLFQGGQSRDFNIVDDQTAFASPSAFAYLQSRVAGLQINDAYSTNPSATWRRQSVSYFLDEIPTDASMLASISMSNIAYIKVFDPPFFGATGGGAGGAIAVYTRKGDDTKTMFVGMDYTLLPGYTPIREFYAPNYAEKQINFTRTDLRRTLHWIPNLLYDGKGKPLTFSFYNNDISKNLQVVVQGITQEGKLIYLSKLLQ
ncbi:MAG: hypothetical protein U9R46_05840 [Bacteroidota bacterium]|nr:hypothetical protein [Bacteroidota bacterium]